MNGQAAVHKNKRFQRVLHNVFFWAKLWQNACWINIQDIAEFRLWHEYTVKTMGMVPIKLFSI